MFKVPLIANQAWFNLTTKPLRVIVDFSPCGSATLNVGNSPVIFKTPRSSVI